MQKDRPLGAVSPWSGMTLDRPWQEWRVCTGTIRGGWHSRDRRATLSLAKALPDWRKVSKYQFEISRLHSAAAEMPG